MWPRPKQFGPDQNNFHLSKTIWTVQNLFGPIEGQGINVNLFFFFRLTKCTFHKYGHSGTIEKHDALCLLALNIISEKIYVFVWFWLIILAVLTAGYMIYTIAVIAIPNLRKTMLQVCHKFFICCSESALLKIILKCSQGAPKIIIQKLKSIHICSLSQFSLATDFL